MGRAEQPEVVVVMACMCGGCDQCQHAQGFEREDEMEQSNWTGAIEDAVREGQMTLSAYLQRCIAADAPLINLTLVCEQVELHEKAIADLDRENRALRRSLVVTADHGEASGTRIGSWE